MVSSLNASINAMVGSERSGVQKVSNRRRKNPNGFNIKWLFFILQNTKEKGDPLGPPFKFWFGGLHVLPLCSPLLHSNKVNYSD